MADLEFTRRSLLAGLAALITAPVKAVLPAAPESAPGPRRWLWVHCSGWHETPNMLDRVLHFTAQRSDGQYFYAVVRERLEDLIGSPELVQRLVDFDMLSAKLTLDDFLHCDCVAEKPCERHYIPPPTPEELAEMQLDD